MFKPRIRSFLSLHEAQSELAQRRVRVLTYNVLAQNLVHRELFPSSGNELKWKHRKRMILDEIIAYDADIACLQELDHVEDFYGQEFAKVGYEVELAKHESKKHGLAILYKPDIFALTKRTVIEYDKDMVFGPPTQLTGNIALILSLRFKSNKDGMQDADQPMSGLVVGTTHLWWQPETFYERARQACTYVYRCDEVARQPDNETSSRWPCLATGDFNSDPVDPTYAVITKTMMLDTQRSWLGWSRKVPRQRRFDILLANHGPHRGMAPTTDEDEVAVDMKETDTVPAKAADEEPIYIGDLKDEDLPSLEEFLNLAAKLPKCHSLYQQYASVDPTMARDIGEPLHTNYTVFYKGTLDYLMVIDDQPIPSITPVSLLSIPNATELGEGLPNAAFGSDHVAIAAEIMIRK
ncbi:hypothetical protein BZG36_02801 [Bifiguratus adelaidae]|uniref:Endonuclease/exonuclease/phosphatase domain-containing protein n=1 Tax=Bifiguratus adelaidae TaxID=1938954 RepID=A0A261Y1I7_9FUNG|nr:hypothetical protein BZG36_02801 [Bifiguratus adelaidae]